jgi:hypothetical protein
MRVLANVAANEGFEPFSVEDQANAVCLLLVSQRQGRIYL